MKPCPIPSSANSETTRAGGPGCWFDKVLALGLLVLLAIVISCSGVAPQAPATADDGGSPPFAKSETAQIAKGTPVFVRLQSSISSARAETGDTFSAVLDDPLTVDGKTVVAEGADLSVRVVAARKSGQMHRPGYLRLALSSITVNGRQIPIQTTSVFVEGGNFGNRNLAYMGGGVGGSSFMGALGGAGTVISSSSSTAGSTSAVYTTGKNEVGFAAERRIGFSLIQPLNVSTTEATHSPRQAGAGTPGQAEVH